MSGPQLLHFCDTDVWATTVTTVWSYFFAHSFKSNDLQELKKVEVPLILLSVLWMIMGR